MTFLEKKEHLKKEIANIAKESYNKEQKALATYILDHATEDNIDAIYTFITQRVKLGFTFDAAPEVNHNCVSICKKNDSMSFGINNTPHKLIIGENYDVLKNLLVSYSQNGEGLIDVIYIDPPYNTESTQKEGNDCKEEVQASKFIYRDKFTRTGWLNMMRERLVLARKLLSKKGVIFISIDDNMQAYLKVLCDDIFGEENFISCFVWQKKSGGGQAAYFYEGHEYVLIYAKHKIDKNFSLKKYKEISATNVIEDQGRYYIIEVDKIRKKHGKYESGEERRCYYEELSLYKNPKAIAQIEDKLQEGSYLLVEDKNNKGKHFIAEKQEILNKNGKFYKEILPYSIISEVWTKDGANELKKIFGEGIFQNPKPVKLLKFLLNTQDKNITILDFFAGSGTTGQAVMELNAEDGGNRQCILVTNNENNIGKGITYERLYRVVNGKGTKNEKFDWTYTKEQPYLSNNCWDVFEIERHELKIDDYEKAKQLLGKANLVFKQLNPEYEPKHDWDIYNQLASLKPYLEEKAGDSNDVN